MRKVGDLKITVTDDEISRSIEYMVDDCITTYDAVRDRFRQDYKLYRGKSIGTEKRGKSQVVASDAFDTVQWIMPDLLDIFSGNIFRVTSEVAPELAVDLENEINRLFNTKPNGFMTKYNMFLDGLRYKFSVSKSYARIKDRVEKVEIPRVMPDEFNAIINDPYLRGKVAYNVGTQPDPISGIETEVFNNVSYNRLNTDDRHIKTDVLSVDEYRFSRLLDEDGVPYFQAHAKVVTMDWLRRKAKLKDEDGKPLFRNVEKVTPTVTPHTQLRMQHAFAEDGLGPIKYEEFSKYSEPLTQTEIWECYCKLDVDEDGLLEDVIVTMNAGDKVVLRVEENKVGNVFTKLMNCPDPHRFEGLSVVEQVEDLAKIRTAIMRHYIENIAQVNRGQWRISPGAQTALVDLLRDHGFYRAEKDQVEKITPTPIDDTAIKALHFFSQEREHKSGVSKAMSGMDMRDLKSTDIGSMGVIRLMRAASKKVRMIAQIYAESGLTDLANVYLNLVKLYIVPGVDPNIPFEASCSIGATELDREDTLRKMNYLLQTAMGFIMRGLPMTDPARLYNIVAEICTAMGLQPRKFFTPPQERGFLPGGLRQEGMMKDVKKMALARGERIGE